MSICQIDADTLVKLLTGAASFATAIIAICAYQKGVKYFNKNHRNSIQIERFKKSNESINLLMANFVELDRIIRGFRTIKNVEELEKNIPGLLATIEDTTEASKEALFIPELSDLRSNFLEWSQAFSSNSDIDLLYDLADPKRLKPAHTWIDKLINDLAKLRDDLRKISDHITPNTDFD